MKRIALILSSFIVCITSYARHQWTECSLEGDSTAPVCSAIFKTGNNADQYRYSAHIEFPEIVPLPDSYTSLWNIRQAPKDRVEPKTTVSKLSGTSYAIIQFTPVFQSDNGLQLIRSCKVVLDSTKINRVFTKAGKSSATGSRLASGHWVKIGIKESGIYQIDFEKLRQLGFNDPSKVTIFGAGGAMLPETDIEHITDDLDQIPVCRTGKRLLFWAQGTVTWTLEKNVFVHNTNPYSEYGYYFLTDSQAETAVFETGGENSPAKSVTEKYDAVFLYEKDEFAWINSGRKLYERTDFSTLPNNTKTYSIHLNNASESDPALLNVAFSDNAAQTSSVTVSVNGNKTGEMKMPAMASNSAASENCVLYGIQDSNKEDLAVQLKHNAPAGTKGHLDYLEFNYSGKLELSGSYLEFRKKNVLDSQSFRISNATEHTTVWQRNADGKYYMIGGTLTGGEFTTKPVSTEKAGQDVFIAFNSSDNFPTPDLYEEIGNQNLHGIDRADMVIIVPQSGKLTAQAERLASIHRTFDSLVTVVVRADMIYNEFSSGTPDATAYRLFMKMLYDKARNAEERPKYLLLLGDGAWDNRMLTSDWSRKDTKDYLLCYESENSLSHTSSYILEDYFGYLQDSQNGSFQTTAPDIGIGRIPVTTQEQAQGVVDKIYRYMCGADNGEWCSKVLLLGDDGDNNLHMSHAECIANDIGNVFPSLSQKKIYWDSYKAETTISGLGYPSVRKDLIGNLNDGVLLVNYSGHGNQDYLSHELIIDKKDFAESETGHLPFWITASCDIAPFDGSTENIGENAILNPKGGSIALLSTTRTVYAHLNKAVNRLFTKYLITRDTDGKYNTFGQALKKAKEMLVFGNSADRDLTENKFHYILLGDPAMRLAIPDTKIIIDSLNHTNGKTADTDQFSAGEVIRLCAHIEKFDGTQDTTYNGIVKTQLFDSKEYINCLNNAGTADTTFKYYDRKNRIFSGSDSVKNGKISILIPISLDISYSGQKGAIYIYANNSSNRSAVGYTDSFSLKGTAGSEKRDSVGPKIMLYLNTPDFENGQTVHATPLLVAELEDSSGINLGTSIGHGIVAIVDNNPDFSYTLNGYYQPATGDYTRGKVIYKMPELPEGKHKLMFRAWDNMNNSSASYLDFEVEHGQKPSIIRFDASPNPARHSTTFYISHDRQGENNTIRLEIFDMAGKPVDTLTGTMTLGTCTIEWNFSQIGLRPGIYIYKVTVECQDGTHSSQTNKLIVL